MQNNFFGSKLNSVLLLVLIILLGFALRFMYQNKATYLPFMEGEKEEVENINPVKEESIAKNEIKKEVKTDLVKYENKDVGFSFVYPAEFGSVTLVKSSPDVGDTYRGSTGKLGENYFFFDFFTKDFQVGDSVSPTTRTFDATMNMCSHSKEVSCEVLSSEKGLKSILIKRLDEYSPKYNMEVYLLASSKYNKLNFTSSDVNILKSIALQIEVF